MFVFLLLFLFSPRQQRPSSSTTTTKTGKEGVVHVMIKRKGIIDLDRIDKIEHNDD